jgi:fructokinase
MNIVAIGEVVVDWLSLKPGESILTASEFHRGLGGNSTNVAIGLSRLGTPVKLVGKVGADFHGDYLKQELQAEGIALDNIIGDERYPTAQCYMTTTSEGEHHFRNWPRPNAADMLTEAELPVALLQAADVLHTSGISMMIDPRRQSILKAVELARQSGAIISFDAGFPTGADDEARRQVETILSRAHLLKTNEFELRFWSGDDGSGDVESMARRVFARYKPTALLVTLAAAGSLIITGSDAIRCEPMKVEALSAVGAGDAYIAGVIHWISELLKKAPRPWADALSGLTAQQWRQAGVAGNICGAFATLEHNAYAGMPGKRQLVDSMAKLSPT